MSGARSDDKLAPSHFPLTSLISDLTDSGEWEGGWDDRGGLLPGSALKMQRSGSGPGQRLGLLQVGTHLS